jgi:RNA polymerase sigma factor (sigma-70 family)
MQVPPSGKYLGRSTVNRIEQLRRAALGNGAGLSDGWLLGLFVEQGDEAAFEALLRRHGPLVWGVCRRMLGHHDAEDAFQATFVVFARKAASIGQRERLAGWLYGVAYRTALKARAVATKRRTKERPLKDVSLPQEQPPGERRELWAVLDREVCRLPEKYRLPVVLCDLEGKGHKEAARQLGWPVGTLSSRLVRARALLARRLALPVGLLAATVVEDAAAALPASLLVSTVKIVGQTATAGVPSEVIALAEGVLRTMLLMKLRAALGVVVTLAILTAGTGILFSPSQAREADLRDDRKAEEIRNTDAAEIESAFVFNDAQADEQFANRRLRVSGTVAFVRRAYTIKQEGGTFFYVILEPKQQLPGGKMLPVTLLFRPDSRKQLADLRSGQRLIAEGACSGRSDIPALDLSRGLQPVILFRDCKVIEVRPGPGGSGQPSAPQSPKGL